MNSEQRNEQELADEAIKWMESGGHRSTGTDAANAHELGQQLRQVANDFGAEPDEDLRAMLNAHFENDAKSTVASLETADAKVSTKSRSWSRGWAIAASLLALGTLAAMLLPSVQTVREAARRPDSMDSDWWRKVESESKPSQRMFFRVTSEDVPSADYSRDDVRFETGTSTGLTGDRISVRGIDVDRDGLVDSPSRNVWLDTGLPAERAKKLRPNFNAKPGASLHDQLDLFAEAAPARKPSISLPKKDKAKTPRFDSAGGGQGYGGGIGGGGGRSGTVVFFNDSGSASRFRDTDGLRVDAPEGDSFGELDAATGTIHDARRDLAYTKDLLTKANNKIVELDPTMRLDGTRDASGERAERDRFVSELAKVRNQFEEKYVKQQQHLKRLLSRTNAPVIVGDQTVHHVKIAELGRKIDRAKLDVAEAYGDRERLETALKAGETERKEFLWTLSNEGKIFSSTGADAATKLTQGIQSRLQELEIARIELVERYGPKHPRSKSVDRQIADFQKQLKATEAEEPVQKTEDFDPEEALTFYRETLDKKIADNQQLIRTSMKEYAIHDAEVMKLANEERQIEAARAKLEFLKKRLQNEAGITDAEQYEPIIENPFIAATGGDAISTFAVDVDTASYANMRRFINNGALPPPNAVRLEELINYFDYEYQQPKGEDPFSVNLELASCPWDKSHQLLRVGLQGKDVHVAERPSTNVVFLIDVSGSMNNQNKLPLLKRGFQMLVDQLNEDDRVSIVTYAGNAGVVLEPTSGDQKQVIKNAIEKLTPGGSTHGSAGIELAYQLAQKNFIPKGSNKVILATDGDLNVGVTNDDQLVNLIKEKAAEGVFLTVLGFGTGNLKDGKLEKLADNGNGVYSYIDSLREAHKVLVEQLSGALLTIAKDVKIQIEFNPAEVKSYRLLGYENRALKTEDFDNDRKDAGEIGAGHSVTALYEIVPAKSKKGQRSAAPVGMKYQKAESVVATGGAAAEAVMLSKAAKSGELATVAVRYKQPDAQVSQRLEFAIANEEKSFSVATDDFRFASAVAAFGMLLRGSEFSGDATLDLIEGIGAGATGQDPSGYRAEFVDLVRKAAAMSDRR